MSGYKAKSKERVQEVVDRAMRPLTVPERYLDAWACWRIGKAVGCQVDYTDVFPGEASPDPAPFPETVRGEKIIRQDETEEGSDKKYDARHEDCPTVEAMAQTVEKAVQSFGGPKYLKRLLLKVHPLGLSRLRPDSFVADPYREFANLELGPNVSGVTKGCQADTYAHVYRQFRSYLGARLKKPEEKSA